MGRIDMIIECNPQRYVPLQIRSYKIDSLNVLSRGLHLYLNSMTRHTGADKKAINYDEDNSRIQSNSAVTVK